MRILWVQPDPEYATGLHRWNMLEPLGLEMIGAALRGVDVIVPVDGLSAGEPYAEQYTSWHLANGPGTRRRCTLTKCNMISFAPEGG